MTISVRSKRLWVFRGSAGHRQLRDEALELIRRGIAVECMLDRSLEAGGPGSPDGAITALVHIYPPVGLWAGVPDLGWRSLGGSELAVIERVAFDRSPAIGARVESRLSFVRIGTQHRLQGVDHASFAAHWWESHAALVQSHMIGITRYAQSFVDWADPRSEDIDGFFESTILDPGVLAGMLYSSERGRVAVEADGQLYAQSARSERLTVRREHLVPDFASFQQGRSARPRT